jgi:hypothetical protein
VAGGRRDLRRAGHRRPSRLGPGLAQDHGLCRCGLLFGGRSETIRGLCGDGRDERFQRIDIHATAFAGTVVITAIIVGFVVELAHGRDGDPYTWLGALGGVAYLGRVSGRDPRDARTHLAGGYVDAPVSGDDERRTRRPAGGERAESRL